MDCQDYSVIPAAIDHDFLMAYRAIEEGEEGFDQITITNKDETFSTLTLSTNPEQGLFERTGSDAEDWINYFICGYKAILSCNEDLKKMVLRPKGLKIYIDSRVPIAVGLSSSAAITVCAAITTLHANGLQRQVPQDLLSELSITAERMAGTACGGMD
jgi:galactokinase